jgi:hypothetical protein
MLSVTSKTYMLSVIMQSVAVLRVATPVLTTHAQTTYPTRVNYSRKLFMAQATA